MLNTLRSAAAGWIAKIFMGVLVLSFAIWGVNDIFSGYGRQAVAEVGDTEVTAEAFNAAYQRELSSMADRLGRRLTPDEARALGVDRRVLGQLLTSAALTNAARQLKLAVSDEYIAREIVTDSTFFDPFGRFHRGRFEQILAANGYSESAYAAIEETRILRDQLTETVTGDVVAPKTLFNAVRDFQGARRVVEYFTVPPIDPATLGEPSSEALTTLYNENKETFTSPEFRALKILALEPADLAPDIEVSEEDIAAEYKIRRSEFETQEKRAVDQILFSDPEKAKAAHARIAAGEDFVAVAADHGFKESDIDLGMVTQSDIVDPAIAKAAFELSEGEISGPVEGSLGTAILRVRSIEPAVVRPLEAVHDEIRDSVALARAAEEVQDLYGAVEDERAAGKSFEDIADTLNLRVIEIPATDQVGRDPEGKAIAELAASPEVLRVAFDSDVGIENDVIDSRTGGFRWVEVTDVTAPAAKPFEQVREQVAELWRERETANRMREKADALVARGREGATMEGLAKSVDAEVLTSEPFTRRSPSTPFAASLIEAIFAAPPQSFLRGSARDDAGVVVVRIKSFLPAEELSEADANELEQQISSALSSDIFQEYVSGLQALDGVTVNQGALGALFGEEG